MALTPNFLGVENEASHENPEKWLSQEGFFHEKKPSYHPEVRPTRNPRKWTKAARPFATFNGTAEKT
jgi:hypothetical protein